ncbi:helix-turn-helix transcriptional regulator [Haloprofundus halobius]|uniref:helix-turn-helix transcriptional regulator n=1 Tax=Haloprofundus halobius TaxID=2876194 RepID=UPI001CC96D55|nr:helix-turn-helix domain-containing protein [Haloprofundus halobius]
MHRRATFVLLAFFLVTSAVAPPATAFSGTRADGTAAASTPQSMAAMQQSFDSSEVQIVVREDGSARWTFHYEQTLANESERQNFRAFADEFNNSETPLYNGFKSESESLVVSGANATERPMDARNHTRQAYVTDSLGNSIGVVEMSFTWTNFAQTEDDGTVTVGDVFEGGLYISENQSLVIESDEELEFKNVTPPGTQSNTSSLPASDSVTWMGEHRFTDNRPQVVFVPDGTQTIVAGGEDGDGEGANGTDDDATTTPIGSGGGSMWLAGAVLAIFGGVVAALWYRRGREETVEPVGSETGDGAEAAAAAPPRPSVSDEELLSDEDRVISMLESHGGRMRQVRIVEETEWSKSKVSMLLSEMEDEGLISKLRVGRENVISLDGHEPEAAKSPFDEE